MKKLMFLALAAILLISVFSLPVAAESGISVYVNGEKLEFDVEPILLNDRTLVPMRKIFETMGATVEWDDYTNTAHGYKDGNIVSVTVDRPEAYVGDKLVKLDQSPIILNDRTLVPLRFVSESLGAQVDWVDATQTVNITYQPKEETDEATFYWIAQTFDDFGGWKSEGDKALMVSADDTPAVKNFTVTKPGKYYVYAKGKDYATNQPGTRFFNVAIDGTQYPEKMGTHGQEGFAWQKVCEVELTAGAHELSLIDTAKFYGRCEAVIVTNKYSEVPADTVSWETSVGVNEGGYILPSAMYPYWSTKAIAEPQATYTIENDGYKLNFVKGWGEKGNFVQSEMFIKNNGAWTKVKDLTEQFGFLMMVADSSKSNIVDNRQVHLNGEVFRQVVTVNNTQATVIAEDFFKSGIPTWFIPSDMQQISDKEILLTFPERNGTTLTVTVSMDDLCAEPKFTLNAKFAKDGAYSFMVFNGEAVSDDVFDSVLAPPHFTKQNVPEESRVYNEPNWYTPIVSYTENTDSGKLTKGVIVDPSSTVQDIAYNETSRFGFILKDAYGNKRAAICAPLFGTDGSNFKAGDTYTFSYRSIAQVSDWYDTFKHVSQDIYNVNDLRTNYYTSLNEAIFNTTDYLADKIPAGREDLPYSGWDDKSMAYGYSEYDNTESQSNIMIAAQRYLLTEDKELLEERVIPTIAFALSRSNYHFSTAADGVKRLGDPTMTTEPTLAKGSIMMSLYQMSQGRMPYLLNAAVTTPEGSGLGGVSTYATLYEVTKDETTKQNMIAAADKVLEKVNAQAGQLEGFILSTYTPYLSALVYAYELTGEQKYLDGAEKVGQALTTALSGKGYQNGYDSNTYHVDPQSTADAFVVSNDAANWYYRGNNPRWRVGLPYGEAGPLKGMQSIVHEEDVPGWLPAVVGLSSEHPFTASNSNFITMNTWASYMVRLSEYTGDDFYKTQARNAIVGRYSNYPGYYVERYYTNYMKPEFPYEGPEYSIIYCTHTPPFLAMLEDFLITSAWAASDGKIDFPQMEGSGYAYFLSSQYGHRPGKMYDVDGLWLWNKRGAITPDSVQLDYVAGRKDGTLAIAFMNQDNKETVSNVTLGDQAAGFTGTATVYDVNGNKSEIQVANGVFTVSVPAKGIATVVMNIPTVTKPDYAVDTLYYNTDLGKTVAGHVNGKAYAIQMTDDEYYAYVYVTDQKLKSLKIDYTVNGETKSETITSFPFETIIKVNGNAEFSYTLTAVQEDGTTASYGKGVIAPLSAPASKNNVTAQVLPESKAFIVIDSENAIDWGELESVTVTPVAKGKSANFRLILKVSDLPFKVVETTDFAGTPVVVKMDRGDGTIDNLVSTVVNTEWRETNIVLNIKMQAKYPLFYEDPAKYGKTEVTLYPYNSEQVPDLPGNVIDASGEGKEEQAEPAVGDDISKFKNGSYKTGNIGEVGGKLRISFAYSVIGFTPAVNALKGVKVKGELINKSNGEAIPFEATVESNDQRETGFVIQTDYKLPSKPEDYNLKSVELTAP